MRQHLETLPFMKLLPQRVRSSSTNLAQSQVTFVGDLGDGETGAVQRTRDYTTRTAASLSPDQIAERIALPAGRVLPDGVGRSMLPSRWSVEREPLTQERVRAWPVLCGRFSCKEEES